MCIEPNRITYTHQDIVWKLTKSRKITWCLTKYPFVLAYDIVPPFYVFKIHFTNAFSNFQMEFSTGNIRKGHRVKILINFPNFLICEVFKSSFNIKNMIFLGITWKDIHPSVWMCLGFHPLWYSIWKA